MTDDTTTTPEDVTLHELEQKRQDRIPRRSTADNDILVERNTDDSAYVVSDSDGNMYEGIGDAIDSIDRSKHDLKQRLLPFSIQTIRLGAVEITPSTRFYNDDLEAYISLDTVTVDGEGRLYVTFTVDDEVSPPLRSFKYDTETLARQLEAETLCTPREIDEKLRELLTGAT